MSFRGHFSLGGRFGLFIFPNRGRRGGFRGEGAGGGRAPGECLWGEGGGAKYFFSEPKCPPSSSSEGFSFASVLTTSISKKRGLANFRCA